MKYSYLMVMTNAFNLNLLSLIAISDYTTFLTMIVS